MDPVVHFEMPAVDRERMSAFYADVFGWKTQMLGEDMGNYTLVTTTDTGADRRPTQPGAINGGFFPKTDDEATHHSLVTISVKDIKVSIGMIERAGGKVVNGPHEIPGVGLYASFIDTEGNRVSMLQRLAQ